MHAGRGLARHSCRGWPLNRAHAWCELLPKHAESAGSGWTCPDIPVSGSPRRIQAAREPAQHRLPALLRARGPAHCHGAPRHEERDTLEGEHGQRVCACMRKPISHPHPSIRIHNEGLVTMCATGTHANPAAMNWLAYSQSCMKSPVTAPIHRVAPATQQRRTVAVTQLAAWLARLPHERYS